MTLTRRHLLASGLTLGAASLLALSPLGVPAALAQRADPRMAPRVLGNPQAKLAVQEWFSLTCTHCARFSREVFPEVKAKLIDTGKIRYEFHDFPLDRVALLAAMVSRALPAERYLPFIESLFASQDRWAFGQNIDPQAQLQKMAALAGLSHADFDKTASDSTLQQAILSEQSSGAAQYKIDSTPTFIFGAKAYPGEMDYGTFAAQVAAAGG